MYDKASSYYDSYHEYDEKMEELGKAILKQGVVLDNVFWDYLDTFFTVFKTESGKAYVDWLAGNQNQAVKACPEIMKLFGKLYSRLEKLGQQIPNRNAVYKLASSDSHLLRALMAYRVCTYTIRN